MGNMSNIAFTAICWVKKFGFEWKEVRKGVSIDEH